MNAGTTLAVGVGLGLALLVIGLRARAAQAAPALDMGLEDGFFDEGPGSVDLIPTEDQQQTATLLESVGNAFDFSSAFAPAPVGDEQQNLRAFLDMIAYSEGTASDPDSGYRTMFGHRLMNSYADHPRQLFTFTNSRGEQLKTSAAGRYQFLQGTWDELRAKLGLQDFGPASQDAACVELIRQRGALDDVKAGRLTQAISKCAKTWASLPGAGYAQPERRLSQLMAAYASAGGSNSEA